jgi:hypothetical protein
MALSASKSFAGSKTFGSSAGSASPARIYSSTPGVSAVYSQSVPSSPRVTSSAADEIRSLRSHNEALQRQLTLKDQGLERLRQKVHERALMLSHEKAADIQQTRREAGTVIEDLEAENARLRSDLAHRTSQLHSAVTRIAALKSRMDDLILRNDELMAVCDRRERTKVAARKRKAVLANKEASTTSEKREAMAKVVGAQDVILNLIENLSFLPPREDDSASPTGLSRASRSPQSSARRRPPLLPAPPAPQPQPPQPSGPQAPVERAKRVEPITTPRNFVTPSTGAMPNASGSHTGGAGENAAARTSLSPTSAEVEAALATSFSGPGGGGSGFTAAGHGSSVWEEYSLDSAAVGTQQASSGMPWQQLEAAAAQRLEATQASFRTGGSSSARVLGSSAFNSSAAHHARYEAAHRRLARFEAKFGQPYASSADGSLIGSPTDRATH